MKVDTVVLSDDFQANCFVVRKDEKAHDCVIIDPGFSANPLIQFLQMNKLEPSTVVLTHGHADHIGGVELIRESWPKVKAAVHAKDADMLTDPAKNLSMMAGTMIQCRPAEIIYDDEETVKLAGVTFHLLHTPGHTPGGICLYSAQQGAAFVGDTIFFGSIGRTDFPGGSMETLLEMIRTKLLVLPEKTELYTGHGPNTTVGNEKAHNPFLT